MKQAVLYRKLEKNLVECSACSWYCRIREGQTGICATRLNKAGKLYSLVYGKAVGLHLDPVEKKPLYHFLPGSQLLSFGTVGCNFGCLFCQNWEQSQGNKLINPTSQINDTNKLENKLNKFINQISIEITPEKIVEMAVKSGAAGIAYTYNEPAVFVEFAHDTARLARHKGLKNVYVSNGFESKEAFDYISSYLDAINIDLKSFRSDFYQKVCKGKIEPVKINIKKFFTSGIETEITTLLIPGHNDSDKDLQEITDFLFKVSPDIPWHVSAFYPHYQMLDIPPTPYNNLLHAYKIGKKTGLKYIYLGNVSETEHFGTRCPRCNELLVKREGYNTSVLNLNTQKGICARCGEKIYGIWN